MRALCGAFILLQSGMGVKSERPPYCSGPVKYHNQTTRHAAEDWRRAKTLRAIWNGKQCNIRREEFTSELITILVKKVER